MKGSVFVEVVEGKVVATGKVISTAHPEAWVLAFGGKGGSTRIIPLQNMLNVHFFSTPEALDKWLKDVLEAQPETGGSQLSKAGEEVSTPEEIKAGGTD